MHVSSFTARISMKQFAKIDRGKNWTTTERATKKIRYSENNIKLFFPFSGELLILKQLFDKFSLNVKMT